MAEYEFQLVPHSMLPGKLAIEVWRDKKFAASIYTHEDGIRIVSKYMTDVSKEPEPAFAFGEWVPSAIIKLNIP